MCQQRKVRCDKQKPCANCVKAQVECRVIPPQPPRRRKKKPHERDLIDRLRKYESLMSQHGISFEPIAHELKPSDHGDDVADLEHHLSGLKTSPSSSTDHVSPGQAYAKSVFPPAPLPTYLGASQPSLTLLIRQKPSSGPFEVSRGRHCGRERSSTSDSAAFFSRLSFLRFPHVDEPCHATYAL